MGRQRVPRHLAALRPVLERLYSDFNRAARVEDPVEFLRGVELLADREIVGFLAAGLAFGRVASVNRSVQRVLAVLGPRPASFVHDFRPDRDGRPLQAFVHRWTRGDDLLRLLGILRHVLREAGSIEQWFTRGWDAASPDVGNAIESFSSRALALPEAKERSRSAGAPGVAYFFPRPSRGGACKRMNLFLRWMVRRDAVDPGGWTLVRPAQLIVPLDVHVVRVGRCLGLTRRSSPGWRMAHEITESLRALHPDDPVRYDFSLCHLGMLNACGFNEAQGDSRCPLRGACRPTARTRPVSRRPSARR